MGIDRAAHTDPSIERLRLRLHHAISVYGDFLHPEVIRASQELDQHLARYFRKQLTYTQIPRKEAHS